MSKETLIHGKEGMDGLLDHLINRTDLVLALKSRGLDGLDIETLDIIMPGRWMTLGEVLHRAVEFIKLDQQI